jgi:hypothetical protein
MEKTIGGLGEVQEEAMSVFTLIVVESRYRSWVEELVKKFAALSPFAPIFHYDKVPGALIHA